MTELAINRLRDLAAGIGRLLTEQAALTKCRVTAPQFGNDWSRSTSD
jgi:hypothetical protein